MPKYINVPGFPGYRVGDDGSVWSKKRRFWGDVEKWRRKTPTLRILNNGGRNYEVCLSVLGKRYYRSVGSLVLSAFVGPRPAGLVCCHIDDDVTNNAPSNLRWGTQQSNCADRDRNGRTAKGSRHHSARLCERDVIALRAIDSSVPLRDAAARLRLACVSHGSLARAVSGVTWKHLNGKHPPRAIGRASGCRHGLSKLNDDSVRRIKSMLSSMTVAAVAAKLGLPHSTVWNIHKGNSWRHVKVTTVI